MRRKICKNCGKEFDLLKYGAYLCPDCSQKAKGATVIRDRVCRQCGTVFPGGPRAWYCPECRQKRRQEQNRRFKQQKKATGSAQRPLGSTDKCISCGAEYIVQSGNQRYCKNCAAAAMREKVNKHKALYAQEHRGESSARKVGVATVCIICGKPFTGRGPSVTCSEECAKKYRSMVWAAADIKRGKRKPPKE